MKVSSVAGKVWQSTEIKNIMLQITGDDIGVISKEYIVFDSYYSYNTTTRVMVKYRK